MLKTRNLVPLATLAMMSLGAFASAQFSDDFDTDTSAAWTVNNGPSDGTANFNYDYSLLGISSAPNSVGGTTKGLRLMANQTNGIFSGLSVSPIGQGFTGDFIFTADVWMNFNGPLPAGGSGSTQVGGMGIGTDGLTAQWPGSVQTSLFFMASGDGNSSVDYRAYSSAAGTGYTDGSGVFFAGTGAGVRNHNNPYYAQFGGVQAPAAQVGLFPQQTGTTLVGSQAFAWHEYKIVKAGNEATFSIDGLNIARVDMTGLTLSGNNIMLMHSDTNGTSSTDPNDQLINTIFDNVKVVPEPGTFVAVGIGALLLLRRRKKA
ncbi:MAG TPA: PEP-CTERM sorting domain-containing protein [Fimbriimonadaceae bacterium]|nr:PEP-CTERM sorting domain-containing protein [Fimbriimonadaceae bacterium]